MNTERLPALFLAHGAPTTLLEVGPVTGLWQGLPQRLTATPRAILCLSAHWESERPLFSGGSEGSTIQYDFYGFPEALYQRQWRLPSDPATADWLQQRLGDLLEQPPERVVRPLDHGVWVPLSHAWPVPPMPVFQLSLCPNRGAGWHIDLGRRLSPLRDQGVLIVGSGGITHNLRELDWQAVPGDPVDWAAEFMAEVDSALAVGDLAALGDPWQLPHGQRNVPTMEHYLPLLVIAGIDPGRPLQPILEHWCYGTLAMHSYAIGRWGAVPNGT